MKPPARSSAAADPPAASESRPSGGLDLGAAFAHAVERADFGFVWCDADLIVRHRHGRIVDFVPLDRPLTESVLALFGMDAQVQSLRRKPQMSIEVPNVSIMATDGATPRLNLQVTWQPRQHHFLLLVSRVMSISELEVELTRHARERQIMEARLVESAEAIARANAELTRANRELAEFAYVISHDLKAPMRAMRYFTEDLENALPEAERAGVREHLAKVREQSRRMSQMLTDLLAYSKIGRKEEAVEMVDTRALVGSITQSMPRPEGLALDIAGHWPRVETAPAPLDLVLRNLIENAIKHHDTGEGRVSVACRPSGNQLLIDIADDGPGIEPRHQSIIFQPFQRLAPDRPVDGSGIGLALVRKTVECCGATLTVSSAPAERRGATFRVTWPCQVIE